MKPKAQHAIAWLALGMILALVTCIYWPGLGGGFVFDDVSNLVNNTDLRVTTLQPSEWMAAIFSSPASNLQRPLAMASFAINHYFTGMDPSAMKLTNLAIHLVNTVLVFQLVQVLLAFGAPGSRQRTVRVSLFVTLAWAAHPINLMAVLYVVQRMESLSQTFVLIGLYVYARTRIQQMQHGGEWRKLALGLVICSLLGVAAKESAVLLPLYAFCLEACLFKFRGADVNTSRRVWQVFVILLFLPAALAVLLVLPQSLQPEAFGSRNFNLETRLLTELRVLVDYLHWSFLPDLDELSLYHDDYRVSTSLFDPLATFFCALALIALILGALLLRRKRPLMALGILWFFSAHLLTATFIPLELMFEHRNYFASLGVCLITADLLLLWPASARTQFVGGVVATMLLGLFCFQTWLRASEWSTPVRFALTEARKHPESPRATYALARILVMMSGYSPESPHFLSAMNAIERARRAPGASLLPAQAALILSARAGKPLKQEWWDDVQAALRIRPVGPEQIGALVALADCANLGQCDFPPQEMLGVFSAALSHGDNPEVLNIYGNYVLNSLGDVDLAIRLWREAARLRPGEPQYAVNLARLFIAAGQPAEAEKQIARLRGMGSVGQNEHAALQLEELLRDNTPPPTSLRPSRVP